MGSGSDFLPAAPQEPKKELQTAEEGGAGGGDAPNGDPPVPTTEVHGVVGEIRSSCRNRGGGDVRRDLRREEKFRGGVWGEGEDGRRRRWEGECGVGGRMKEEFAGSKAKGRRWGLGGRGAEMGVVGRGWGCLNAFLCIAHHPPGGDLPVAGRGG